RSRLSAILTRAPARLSLNRAGALVCPQHCEDSAGRAPRGLQSVTVVAGASVLAQLPGVIADLRVLSFGEGEVVDASLIRRGDDVSVVGDPCPARFDGDGASFGSAQDLDLRLRGRVLLGGLQPLLASGRTLRREHLLG